MSPNRILQIAFAASVATHGVFLAQHLEFSLSARPRPVKTPEVQYVRVPIEPKQEIFKTQPLQRQDLMPLTKNISVEEKDRPALSGDDSKIPGELHRVPAPAQNEIFTKPMLDKTDVITIKKKITLPPLEQDNKMSNNPSYMSYYQVVREKIKRGAYRAYTGREQGEVTVSFIISSDGRLESIKMIESRSSASPYLRDVAVRSVKSAAAFPVFPKELNFPELSFNVAITFEVE